MKCRREQPANVRQFAAAAASSFTFSLRFQDASSIPLESLINEIQRTPVLCLMTVCTQSYNREVGGVYSGSRSGGYSRYA